MEIDETIGGARKNNRTFFVIRHFFVIRNRPPLWVMKKGKKILEIDGN